MRKIPVEVGFNIPGGKGIVIRDAGTDGGDNVIVEFDCYACGKQHLARWYIVRVGGPCQACERVRKAKEFQDEASRQDRYTLEKSFELAENKGAKTAARILGVPVMRVQNERWEMARRIMNRVPKAIQKKLSAMAQSSRNSMELMQYHEIAVKFKLTVAAIKLIVRRTWNAAIVAGYDAIARFLIKAEETKSAAKQAERAELIKEALTCNPNSNERAVIARVDWNLRCIEGFKAALRCEDSAAA